MTVELSADQRALQARVREFSQDHVRKRALETDQSEQYPWDIVEKMVESGFFGMTVPTAYGGQGRSYLDAVLLIEEMAKECGVTGRIAVEANMGAVSAIMAYGSDEQKKLAADLVLAGDKPAICITEPAAGSAATEMTTRADKRGNGYVLNGAKHWITGAGVSRLHLIFARVFDEAGEEQGIGGFRQHGRDGELIEAIFEIIGVDLIALPLHPANDALCGFPNVDLIGRGLGRESLDRIGDHGADHEDGHGGQAECEEDR